MCPPLCWEALVSRTTDAEFLFSLAVGLMEILWAFVGSVHRILNFYVSNSRSCMKINLFSIYQKNSNDVWRFSSHLFFIYLSFFLFFSTFLFLFYWLNVEKSVTVLWMYLLLNFYVSKSRSCMKINLFSIYQKEKKSNDLWKFFGYLLVQCWRVTVHRQSSLYSIHHCSDVSNIKFLFAIEK